MKIEGRHELQAASLERPVTGEEATVVLVKARRSPTLSST